MAALPEPIGFLCMRVGDVLLLWFFVRVGVYLIERVEEPDSDPMLRRRVGSGILDGGDRCLEDDLEERSLREWDWPSCCCDGAVLLKEVEGRCAVSRLWLLFC